MANLTVPASTWDTCRHSPLGRRMTSATRGFKMAADAGVQSRKTRLLHFAPALGCAHMLRFDRSTDSKLVFFDNGKLSVKIYFAELEEPFAKN
jgi:hypothetical protein